MSIEPGSAGQFVHKAEVLASHSEAIGRDPLTIKRMPEISVVLRETREQAIAAFEAYAGHFAWTDETRQAMQQGLFAGSVDDVASMLQPFLDAGLDGLVYQALPPYDLETIRALASELRPALRAEA